MLTKTSLNWSHNSSKNYTVDSLSRNRCQRPLTNCHTAETAGKWWRKDDPWPRDFPDIYLPIKWFQGVTNALFKRLAPLWIHWIQSCENYYVAMPSSSDLGATKAASTKSKSNSTRPEIKAIPPFDSYGDPPLPTLSTATAVSTCSYLLHSLAD